MRKQKQGPKEEKAKASLKVVHSKPQDNSFSYGAERYTDEYPLFSVFLGQDLTRKMALSKHLRANSFSFPLLIMSRRRKYILRYSPQFILSSKSIQNCESARVSYKDRGTVPALPILAGPEHEHQQVLGGNWV